MILECFIVYPLYEKIISGNIIPDKIITLGDFGIILLVTIGDTAFPKHARLLQGYNEDTRNPKQIYFNTKLCSARVVTENAYCMLKGRFRILYKKTECRLKKSEACNNGLCYAAQSLYLCKGSVLTPLATSSEATWSCNKSLRKKGRQKCFRVKPIQNLKLAMGQLSNFLFLHDI